jgi:hypothetical protein
VEKSSLEDQLKIIEKQAADYVERKYQDADERDQTIKKMESDLKTL